jgi:Bax protein
MTIRDDGMKRYERKILMLLGGLVAIQISATITIPPKPVTVAPKAILPLIAAAEIKPAVLIAKVEAAETTVVQATPAQAQKLYDSLRKVGYRLETVMSGETQVPRVFLASLPQGMADLREVRTRKDLFVKTVLPLILQVNEEITADRQHLVRVAEARDAGESLSRADQRWLTDRATRYNVEPTDLVELRRRMDVIPPSLALAQAAEESGWGTSRFVLEGNALFGQYSSADEPMMVPTARDEDKSHAVRTFTSLLDSVRAYALNLNTHFAYKRYRDQRAKLRETGKPLDGLALAPTLTRYSARGEDYTRSLRSLIVANEFLRADKLTLKDSTAPQPMI